MRGAAWHPQRRSWLGRALNLRHLSWERVQWPVLGMALVLLGIGLVFVRHMDLADFTYGRDDVNFAGHLRKVALTVPLIFLAMLVRPRWLRRNAWIIYGLAIVLLLLVPLIGEERNNARRWIPLPGLGFDLQPSELAKLGLILVLARVLYTSRMKTYADFVAPALLALLPMGLVVLQPDLGTALTIVPVTLGMFYLAGAAPGRLATLVALAALAGLGAWGLGLVRDYQLQRVETWVSSMHHEQLIDGRNGPGFHTYHAITAMGNGSWMGTGLGQGVANEAGHLPERDSDSIFAVVAEEAGFVGTMGIVLLYALMIAAMMLSASAIRERFTRLVVGGIALYFAAHFFINIGVNLALLPMTGLTLPLFSTGGSSLLVTFLALGLALGLAAQQEATLDQDAFRS